MGAAHVPHPHLLCGELGSCVAYEANSTFYLLFKEQQRLAHQAENAFRLGIMEFSRITETESYLAFIF